ncbi:hypothetical protein D4R99_04640, partial [bacterium]
MKKTKLFFILVSLSLLLNVNANASILDNIKIFVDRVFSPAPEQITALNYESFDGTTFPPTGWTQEVWNYSQSWSRATVGGNPYCLPHSGSGMARITTSLPSNVVDHSWLITPSFSLTSGQGIVSFWMYRSIDSPGAPDSLGVWVNTVPDSAGANFTWLGQIRRASPTNGWYQYTFLIPASFNGATNYILFGAWGFGGANIYIDDVSFGVPANMTYVSSNVTVNTNPVSPNTVENQVISIPLTVTGTLSPFNISKFKLRTAGTTNPSNDIRNAKIYYTGLYGTFTTSSQYATLYGNVVANPNGSFEIAGAQNLFEGTNYFWLTYDITSGAIQSDTVSAVCDSIIGSGIGSISPVPASPGGRVIYTPLSGGTYIIGPGQISPNYPTFSSAFADLNLRGISGPVTFNVKPAIYGTDLGVEVDSTITLNAIYGTSPINTITFKKKSDEAGEVWIERRGTST